MRRYKSVIKVFPKKWFRIREEHQITSQLQTFKEKQNNPEGYLKHYAQSLIDVTVSKWSSFGGGTEATLKLRTAEIFRILICT